MIETLTASLTIPTNSPIKGIIPLGVDAVLAWSADDTLCRWNLKSGEAVFRCQHRAPINYVIVAHGRLITACADNGMWIWHQKTGALIQRCEGHSHCVNHVTAFYPNGLVTGSADCTLRTWNITADSVNPVHCLEGHDDCVNCVRMGPYNTAMSGGADGALILWDVRTGKLLQRFTGHTGPINWVVLLDQLAFSNSADGTCRVWEAVVGGRCLAEVEAHGCPVYRHVITSDVCNVVSCGDEREAITWQWRVGRRGVLKGHGDIVRCLAINAHDLVATGSADGTLRLWDLRTLTSRYVLVGHTDRLNCVEFAADGRRLVSGSNDRTIRTWEVPATAVRSRLDVTQDNVQESVVATSASARSRTTTQAIVERQVPLMKWDVFISHASEDKPTIVLPLAEALKRRGVRVWLDKHQLRLGDRLRDAIETGLRESRYGIVILSESFFAKEWPQSELDSLFALEAMQSKRILPIRHQVTAARVTAFSPMLGSRLSICASVGVNELVANILDVLGDSRQ